MIGGLWGMSPTEWVAPVAQNEDWFLLAAKFMWRQGLVRCPETCSMDTPVSECLCDCPAAILAGRNSTQVLKDAGVMGLFGGDAILSELCHVGLPGELFTSAAPQDPLFWPLHGNAERFLQYVRLVAATGVIELNETWGYDHVSDVASDTGLVCDWSTASGLELPTCARATCPGHREHDLLPFAGLYAGQSSLLTNGEFYDKIGPGSTLLPYVYNSISYWPGCTDDVMIVTDDDATNDDHYTQANASTVDDAMMAA